MTIDEAIKKERKAAADESVSVACRSEHRQYAGWLEELKELRKEKRSGWQL